MLNFTIDHVVWAHPHLDKAVETFKMLGFAPVAGGKHGSGATENALIPFTDGSYIELLSRVDGGGASPMWEELLAANAGWGDWCLGVPDVEAAAQQLRADGFSLRGPFAMHRDRPGGLPRAAWNLAFVRQESAGGALPFLIQDTAPRENRVPAAPKGNRFKGIHQVIVAVLSIETWQVRFATYFGVHASLVTRPDLATELDNTAMFVELTGTPVILVKPGADGALRDRLTRFGAMLAGIILSGDENRWLATDAERGLIIGAVASANTSMEAEKTL